MNSEHQNQSLVIVALVTVVMVVFYLAGLRGYQQLRQDAGRSYTMQVCSQMASGSDFQRVKACGSAQREYNLEYICNGDTADSGCWVEEK